MLRGLAYHRAMTSIRPHTSPLSETPETPSTAGALSTSDSTPRETAFKEKPQLWTPLFALIILATLCCFMTGQGLNSGTSVFLDRLGESATFSGILATVFSISAAATRLVCGPLIDRTGRYGVMVGGMVLLVVGCALPSFVSDSLVFVACRVVQGIGFSAATTALATAAADVLPVSRLGEGIGYYGLGQALAMSIGPALGLYLVATDPAENLYFGLALVAAIGCVLAAGCRYEHNPARLPETSAFRRKWEGNSQPLKAPAAAEVHVNNKVTCTQEEVSTADNPRVAPCAEEQPIRGIRGILELRALPGALPMLVMSPAFGFGIFFVGLYGTSLNIGNAGLFYTLSALSMIAVRLKSSSFMDNVAPRKVFAIAVVSGLIGYALLFAASASPLLYYAAGIFYGMCLGISMPLNQSVAVKNTPPARWGATNALYLLATDIGIGISSMIWGIINDSFGFTTAILCVMACIAASYLIAWFIYPRET